MKKIILKGIAFLLILFLMLLLLSKIFVPKNNTVQAGIPKNKIREYGVFAEPENTLDVIMIGDSEAYTSFIPLEAWHEYGYTSYVCGSPAQKMPAITSVLYDILKEQSPKLVMLEANTLYKEISISAPVTQIMNKVLPAIQYHNRWKKLTPEDFWKDVDYTNVQKNKGFYLSQKIDSGKNKKYMKKSNKREKIPEMNVFYVKLMKKYCDAKNIEFVLYSTPAAANWTTEKHNGVEKLAKTIDVEYIDMNLKSKEIGIDWEVDSRDKGDHLNITGSKKTTRYLAKYLDDYKNLPDHRQDENYKAWNKYYKKYVKSINKD